MVHYRYEDTLAVRGGKMQKKDIKRLAISFVIVLVVNILILSIVNYLQISYWENAPEEEIIYNMVAGENEKGIEYLYKDTNFCIDDDDAKYIEKALKENSAVKLSKKESYKMLYLLNKKFFALYFVIPDNYKSDGTIESIKEPISQLWFYLYDNSVYIVRATDERQTDSSKREFAVYVAKDKSELYDVLNQYVDESGDGIFYCTIPEWLDRVRNRGTVYLSHVVWEMYLVSLLLKKIKRKNVNNVDV